MFFYIKFCLWLLLDSIKFEDFVEKLLMCFDSVNSIYLMYFEFVLIEKRKKSNEIVIISYL